MSGEQKDLEESNVRLAEDQARDLATYRAKGGGRESMPVEA
jgi:hypothetical protein